MYPSHHFQLACTTCTLNFALLDFSMTKLKCELLALTKGLGGGGLVNLLDLVWIIRPVSVECNQSWNAMVLVHVKKRRHCKS